MVLIDEFDDDADEIADTRGCDDNAKDEVVVEEMTGS